MRDSSIDLDIDYLSSLLSTSSHWRTNVSLAFLYISFPCVVFLIAIYYLKLNMLDSYVYLMPTQMKVSIFLILLSCTALYSYSFSLSVLGLKLAILIVILIASSVLLYSMFNILRRKG